MVCRSNMHPATLSRDWAHSPFICRSQCERCRSLHFGWEGFPWPKPTLTPPTAHLSCARQDLQFCLSTSSVSLWATPVSVAFLALWRAVFCAVTHCTPLAYPAPSALLYEFCHWNSAIKTVQWILHKDLPHSLPHLARLAPFLAITSHLDALNKR